MTWLFLCALLAPSSIAGGLGPLPAGETLFLEGVLPVDGEGQASTPVRLVIQAGAIVALEDPSERSAFPDGEALALDGHFVTPGLWEAHAHLASNPSREGYLEGVQGELRRFLGRGITDVRDMAGDARVLGYLARETRLGRIPGPDIHYGALLGGPRLFGDPRLSAASQGVVLGRAPWARELVPGLDLDRVMAEARGAGACGVKLYADFSPEFAAEVAAAAREADLRIWSHWVLTPGATGALDAVEAGVEVVSHAHMLMHDAAPDQRGSVEAVLEAVGVEELLDAMLRRGTILDATLAAAEGLRPPPGYVQPIDFAAELTRMARARGIPIVAGSDHPGAGGLPGLHVELRLLVERGGLTPEEALRAATRTAARCVGLGAERGGLASGQRANLVILSEDPRESVSALEAPRYVVHHGRLYEGAALREGTGPVLPLFDASGD